MKTKNHASKARVSKIPPKSFSILALAISQATKPTTTTDPDPPDTQPSSQNPNPTPSHQTADTDPETSNNGGDEELVCNGKDCGVSVSECGDLDCFGDDGRFYCPCCLYECAIGEVKQAEEELKLGVERARFARRALYEFVGGSAVQGQVGGDEPISGNAGQGVVGAEPDDVVMAQVDIAGSENGNGRGISGVDIGCVNDDSRTGICNGEKGVCKRDLSVVHPQCSLVSGESGGGNGDSRVDIGGNNAVSTSGICNTEHEVCKQNEGIVNQQRSSVLEECGDGNGDSRVDIGGNNDVLTSGICNREQEVCEQNKSIGKQQCSSVLEECGDENEDSRVDIGGNNDVSTSGICIREQAVCEQNKGKGKQQCSSVSEESSDDNSDGGEEGFHLPDKRNGWRKPRQKTNNALRMNQNGGENGQRRQSKSEIGMASRNAHRVSTDEGDPFAVYRYQDESVARVGNINPLELRKRPLETSSGRNEVNIYENSANLSMNPIMSESRRKRIRWTPEEEKILLEAVEICSSKCRKNMCWASVLQYGSHVFNGNRTHSELRDKWRTMVKGRRKKPR